VPRIQLDASVRMLLQRTRSESARRLVGAVSGFAARLAGTDSSGRTCTPPSCERRELARGNERRTGSTPRCAGGSIRSGGVGLHIEAAAYAGGRTRLSQARIRVHIRQSARQNLVEIKWQILSRFYSIEFEIEDLFNAAVEVDLSGHKLRTLSDQDLMLVLCVHAAKHGWRQISWLCDITQLAQSRTLDWEGLGIQAGKLGIARIVAVSFLLAQKSLGTSLPERLEAQSDPSVEPLAQKILQQIVEGNEFDSESFSYFRLIMDLRERRRDRASFAWRLWVTPSTGEWSAVRLPTALFPLYRAVTHVQAGQQNDFFSNIVKALTDSSSFGVAASPVQSRLEPFLYGAPVPRFIHRCQCGCSHPTGSSRFLQRVVQ
jgi:hypothetical protein